MNISKELFKAVMGNEYKDRLVDVFKCEEDAIRTYYDCGKFNDDGEPTGLGFELSYNDFFFKCKEWMANNGYYPVFTYTWLGSDAEKQMLFDGAQWILENK